MPILPSTLYLHCFVTHILSISSSLLLGLGEDAVTVALYIYFFFVEVANLVHIEHLEGLLSTCLVLADHCNELNVRFPFHSYRMQS